MTDLDGNWSDDESQRAIEFCKAYLDAPQPQRYIFGRNVYARAVAAQLEIAAYIDDFTDLTISEGKPVVRSADIPHDALVLAASGGMPLSVAALLNGKSIRNLDYFAFYKWSGLNLPEAVFNESFNELYKNNKSAVVSLYEKLEDDESRSTLERLFAFRNTYNLGYLEGFKDRQKEQYFEDFLQLQTGEAVFVDVGCFDGYTTQEFVKRVPTYEHIYIFEPDRSNRAVCATNLKNLDRLSLLPYGAGKTDETLRFSQAGSASSINPDGTLEIEVRRIDGLVDRNPSFIKMDIEGAEMDAIAGARETIRKSKPTLAICVYHRPSDFWEVPKAILDLVPGYKVYLRHYTESIYETVMYFVHPNEGN